MRTRLFLIAALGAIFVAALMTRTERTAHADANTYATLRRKVRCAILTSSALNVPVPAPANVSPENPDPHVFYVLDSRTDLKPYGMEFMNPLAPPVLTNSIYQRWKDRVRGGAADAAFDPTLNTPESRIFQVGARVTKNMGAYWELNLDSASVEDLRNYDILYLHSHKVQAVFSVENREKLRKFVEAGGTLWVENCGSLSFSAKMPFLFEVSMSGSLGSGGQAIAVVANASHPLLSYPYVLGSQDVQNLGDKYTYDPTTRSRFLLAGYYLYKAADSNDTAPGQNAVNPPGEQTLVPIVWNTRGLNPSSATVPNPGWRPLILAGQVGAGRIIFASQDSGCTINDYVGGTNAGYGGNSGAVSGETFAAAVPADLKFSYNIASWSGAHTTVNTDPRHTNATSEVSGGALSEKFPVPIPAGLGNPGSNATVGGAAMYKHCIYAVDGNLILHCYDSKPGEDLDGDGNSDDGQPDYIIGLPYDEVWSYDLKSAPGGGGGPLKGASTPTVFEFYDPNSTGSSGGLQNFQNRELVVVVLSDGRVVALRALPRAAATNFPLAPVTAVDWVADTGKITSLQAYPITGNQTIPAATFSEGVLFVGTNVLDSGGATAGRVVAIDPLTGGGAFTGTTPFDDLVPNNPGSPPFIGAPTVGYVVDAATGASDKMVYIHADHLTSGGNESQPQGVLAFPFGTKGEQLTRQGANSFVSRCTGTQPPVPWFRVDPTSGGNPLLKQRVFAAYTDPAGGFHSIELDYAGNTAGAPGASNQYAAPQPASPGQFQSVIISGTIDFGGGVTAASTDGNLRILADYTLDWTLSSTSPAPGNTLPRVTARNAFLVPKGDGQGNLVGGPPSISSDDLIYFVTDTTSSPNSNGGRGTLYAFNEQSRGRTNLKWSYVMYNEFNLVLNDGTTIPIQPRLRNLKTSTATLTGTTNGAYITDVQFIGSPAVRNGVVYAVAKASLGGTPVSVLCAFRANPTFVLHLNTSIDRNTTLTVWQYNPATAANGQTKLNTQLTPQQYTVDYDSGTVRITSMGISGSANNFFSASLPFVVQSGTQQKAIFATQEDIIGGNIDAHRIGPQGIDNLLWYAVIPAATNPNSAFKNPGFVSSSPSIQDNVLWLGFENGVIMSMDADPGANDPTIQGNGNQVDLVDPINAGTLVHLRWAERVTKYDPTLPLAPTYPILVAPIATESVLAVNTAEGTHAYEDSLTLIADARRLVEVNSAGEAVWVCEGTRSYGTAGGDVAQFIDTGGGNIIPVNPNTATGVPVVQKVPFARPSMVRRLGLNEMLVVDTGNNRVVQIDRGGNVTWEVHRLFDDMYQLLRPGDPLNLSEPTDCNYTTEYVPNMNQWFAANGLPTYTYNNNPGYVLHYLIADTGNFRVIELVDVYNAAGQPVRPTVNGNPAAFTLLRQVFFVSSTFSQQGKKYQYRGAQRTVQRNGDLTGAFHDPALPANAIRRFTLTAIANARLGSGSTAPDATADTVESSGGSIVVLDEKGKPVSVVTNLAIPLVANPMTEADYRLQPINGPTSFSKFDVFNPMTNTIAFHYLLTDANGCYQMRSGVVNGTPVMLVEWQLTAQDYYLMTGKKLAAYSLRRLNTAVTDSTKPGFGLHHFLITNRFTGSDFPAIFGITYTTNPATGNISGVGEFKGEVFEIDPANYNPLAPANGYTPDYVNAANYLLPNAAASIVFRAPTESVPFQAVAPNVQTGPLKRSIGFQSRATSTGLLEQPSFADRPF